MAFQKNKNWAEHNKEKMKELQKQVKTIAETYVTNPDNMIDFIKFKSQFYNYSVKNTMLIKHQLDGAVFCGSFQFWKDRGFSVEKGQKGLKIFVPVVITYYNNGENSHDWKRISEASKEDKEKIKKGEFKTRKVQTFKIGTVFDITQTTCPIEEYGKFIGAGYASEQHATIFSALSNYSKDVLDCPVTLETTGSALRGFFSPAKNRIAINEKLLDTQKLSTLAHELGHALMHNVTNNKSTTQKELEADAFSIMLENHFGIEITDARKDHFINHLDKMNKYNDEHKNIENPITLDEVLENVSKYYSDVIEDITHYIDKELVIDKSQDKDINLSQQIHTTPYVKIIWSESNQLKDGAILPVKKANDMFKQLDIDAQGNDGYAKTKFQIIFDADITYEGRYDIGVENCGLIQHISDFCENDLPIMESAGLLSDEELKEKQLFVRDVVKNLWDCYDKENLLDLERQTGNLDDIDKNIEWHKENLTNRALEYQYTGKASECPRGFDKIIKNSIQDFCKAYGSDITSMPEIDKEL